MDYSIFLAITIPTIIGILFIADRVWPGDRRFVQRSIIERGFDWVVQRSIEFCLYSFYTWIPAAGIGMLLGGTKQEQAQIGLIAIILINVWVIRYMNRKP